MIELYTTLQASIINALSQIIGNSGYIVLIIWATNKLSKKIEVGIKQIPKWLEQYDKIKLKHYQIDNAVKLRNKTL
jgi:hypothetical protein